jgi:hypothetical protein
MKNTLYQSIFQNTYLKNSNNIDECLSKLKSSGASQIDCVKILIWGLKISLKEADAIVLQSTTWEQSKEATESFRNNFISYIENSHTNFPSEN